MNKVDVLWVASFPKSGNSWVNRTIRTAGLDYGFPPGEMGVYALTQGNEKPQPCPAVRHAPGNIAPSVLKTHAPFDPNGLPHVFPGMQLRTFGFVHIYRNPLDLLLSYINYSRIELGHILKRGTRVDWYRRALFQDLLGFDRSFDYETWLGMGLDAIPQRHLDHALKVFSDSRLTIATLAGMSGSWIDHTQSWLDAGAHCPGTTLKYEDCVRDPEHLTAVARHFVFDADSVREATTSVQEKIERRRDSGKAEAKIFFNKMTACYFPEYFSRSAIAGFIREQEAVLQRFGYGDLVIEHGDS